MRRALFKCNDSDSDEKRGEARDMAIDTIADDTDMASESDSDSALIAESEVGPVNAMATGTTSTTATPQRKRRGILSQTLAFDSPHTPPATLDSGAAPFAPKSKRVRDGGDAGYSPMMSPPLATMLNDEFPIQTAADADTLTECGEFDVELATTATAATCIDECDIELTNDMNALLLPLLTALPEWSCAKDANDKAGLAWRLDAGDDDVQRVAATISMQGVQVNFMFMARGFVDAVERFGVPPLPDDAAANAIDESAAVEAERARWRGATTVDELDQAASRLTHEQRRVHDAVVNAATGGAPQHNDNVFVLCASAGCGKTYVARLIVDRLRAADHIVVVVATTGIAATMLPGGTTVHRRFAIPIEDRSIGNGAAGAAAPVDDNGITDARPLECTLPPNHPNLHLLKRASLLLWDEAFSANRRLFDATSRFLSAQRNDPRTMGGLVTLLLGDPRQIPPIVPGTLAERAVLTASLQSWIHWRATRKFVLTRAMRQADDAAYASLLTAIGDGQAGVPVGQANDALTHKRVLLRNVAALTSREQFHTRVFPRLDDPVHCVDRAIICARNDDVLAWNNAIIDRLPGEATRLTAVTQLADYADQGEAGRRVPMQYSVFTDEYLAQVQPSGVPPHTLLIKPGTIAVLISNLSPDDGLTNGTKLIIDRVVSPRLIEVRARSPVNGELTTHLIPRLRFKFKLHRTNTNVVRTQFPLLPAFAITCNRAQCQTLSFVGFDATVPQFSHGSLFVALSRARRSADVAVFVGSDARAAETLPDGTRCASVVNVVFPDLIKDIIALTNQQLQQNQQQQQQQHHH